MKIIADTKEDEGVLYHCTAGKDRTGVISAILLSLVGASQCDILADYQISYAYTIKLIRQLCKENPDFPAYIVEPRIEYMEKFLELFNEKYGSSEKYLLEIGLTDLEIEKLKKKLLIDEAVSIA